MGKGLSCSKVLGGASLIRLDIKATGIRLREVRDKRPGQESKLRRG